MASELLPIEPALSSEAGPRLSDAVLDRIRSLRTRPAEGAEAPAPGLEQLIGRDDTVPVRFLRTGAERARSVCRIVTREGYGSGFLVGPTMLMTNNHVLASAAAARAAQAEFDYELGMDVVRVALDPQAFFYTSVELDFTLVACAPVPGDRPPLRLSRDPVGVVEGDPLNIIQHPRGLRKRVAVRGNQLHSLDAKYLYYTTDTEPGSSGSPVFNNDWDLVALHHFALEKDGKPLNRGIRIAPIVRHLESIDFPSRALTAVLGGVETSRLLGLFDTAGIGGPEIEVRGYQGAGFMDVGFWNIVDFHTSEIRESQLDRVADVLRTLSLDALGLVEVGRTGLEELMGRLRQRGLAPDFLLHDTADERDIAIVFDTTTTKVTKVDRIYQEHADALKRKASNGSPAFPRTPLFAEVEINHDGAKVSLLMVVVHLKSKRGNQADATEPQRRLAGEILRTIVERETTARPQLPVVIGGDYNESITSDVLAALRDLPGMRALTRDDEQNKAATYLKAPYKSVIDHVLVTGDLKIDTTLGDDALIVRLDLDAHDFVKNVSDHAPVVMRLVASDAAAPEPDGDPAPVPAPDAGSTRVEVPHGSRSVVIKFE